jgi:hypothetical protein
MYGKFPLSEAWRPDDEEGVITADGKKICKTCAQKWYEGKIKAEQEELNLSNSSKSRTTKYELPELQKRLEKGFSQGI